MDPGWPANPPNTLICILCKSAVPFNNSNPERFFRHLLADHFTFFNLNFLLEFSLMQPHATIWENSFPVPGDVQNVAKTVSDQVKALPVNTEMKARPSNLVEADSTSDQDQLTSQLLLETSSSEDKNPGSFSLEETCQSAEESISIKKLSSPIKLQPKTIACSNLQMPAKAQPNPTVSISDQLTHEDLNNNFLINPIAQLGTTPKPHGFPFPPRVTNPIPLRNLDPYNPMTVNPEFSALDPIFFVKQKPRSKRKLSRLPTVNRNNQPVPCLPDKPNRNIVPEDLQMLIYENNPSREIKFTCGQMVMDEYVLKKKKGPYLMRGGRVVNWSCIDSNCQYTAQTWEGEIRDTASMHNHPSQAALVIKKAKMRENMAVESWNDVEEGYPVIKSVKNGMKAKDTNSKMKSTAEKIDARQKVVKEEHWDSQHDLQPNISQELSPWENLSPDAFKNAYCLLIYEMEIAGRLLKKTIKTLMSNSAEKSMNNFSTHVGHNIEDLEFKSNGIVLCGEELAGSIDRGLISVSRRVDKHEVEALEVSTFSDLIQECQLNASDKALEAPDAKKNLVNDEEDEIMEHVLQFYNF